MPATEEIVERLAAIIASVMFPVESWERLPEAIKGLYLHIARSQVGWLKTEGFLSTKRPGSVH